MTMRPPDPRLLGFLSAYDPAIVELALAVRNLVLEEAPDAVEAIYDAYSAVAIGFSFTGKFGDSFCHVATYSKHVNLGFNQGASLPDPNHVLQGSGKQIRHITIRTFDDLAKPFLRSFLETAIAQVPKLDKPLAVKSVVRGDYPVKRRPGSGGRG